MDESAKKIWPANKKPSLLPGINGIGPSREKLYSSSPSFRYLSTSPNMSGSALAVSIANSPLYFFVSGLRETVLTTPPRALPYSASNCPVTTAISPIMPLTLTTAPKVLWNGSMMDRPSMRKIVLPCLVPLILIWPSSLVTAPGVIWAALKMSRDDMSTI